MTHVTRNPRAPPRQRTHVNLPRGVKYTRGHVPAEYPDRATTRTQTTGNQTTEVTHERDPDEIRARTLLKYARGRTPGQGPSHGTTSRHADHPRNQPLGTASRQVHPQPMPGEPIRPASSRALVVTGCPMNLGQLTPRGALKPSHWARRYATATWRTGTEPSHPTRQHQTPRVRAPRPTYHRPAELEPRSVGRRKPPTPGGASTGQRGTTRGPGGADQQT